MGQSPAWKSPCEAIPTAAMSSPNRLTRKTHPRRIKKSHLRRPPIGEWPWRSLKVIGIAAIRQVIYHFLFTVYSNNISVLHCAPDNYHFHSVRDSTCSLEMSFSSRRQLKLQVTFAFRLTRKHIRVKTRYVSRSIGVRKISNIKSDFQGHSRSLVGLLMPFDKPFDRPHTISY